MREDGTDFGEDSWSDFRPAWLDDFCEKNPAAGPKVWILTVDNLACVS